MSTKRVQVATTVFNEPIPGVIVDTDLGEVVLVFDIVTGTMGIHAPDEMIMSHVIDIIELVNEEYTENGVNPFEPDDTVPLVVETDFIFRQLGA